MEIERKFGNCTIITANKTTIVVDPNLSSFGIKDQIKNANIYILTSPEFGITVLKNEVVIDGPGEYEINNISIKGILTKAHLQGQAKSTIYNLDSGDIRVAILGNVSSKITEEQLEEIGTIDVAILPIGGGSETLSSKEAVEVLRKLEPKIIVPTHYQEDGPNYEESQESITDFVKDLGADLEKTDKLKLKTNDLTADKIIVYQISPK